MASQNPDSLHPIGPDHQLPAPPSPHPSHLILKIVITLLVLLGFAAIFYYVWHHHTEAAAAPSGRRGGGGPITITTAKAKTGDIGVYLKSIGTVTPVYTTYITAQAGGPVTNIHYTEGQIVQKGDPLLDIDDRPYQATLLQAQGALERDENLLAQAKMDLERYRVAWARNAIPKQTLDDQEKLVLQDEGTVKNDRGTVQYDEIQVEYCHIKAPIAGQVGLRLLDPGNVVQANSTTPLAVITQLTPITVVFTIAEDSIGQVQPHLKAGEKLHADAYDRAESKKLAGGQLLALDNQIDTTTGTVKGRAQFDNEEGNLFPNQFVNIRLLVETLQNVVLIPSSAVQHNEQVAYVYVIEDGVAHMQNITTGVTDGGMIEVSGLPAGTVVANSGFERLTDKSKVTIAPQAPANSTSRPATSTSRAGRSTSRPAKSTSRPTSSTSTPALSTSSPATSTSAPDLSTSGPATSTSGPAVPTSGPTTPTPSPDTQEGNAP